MRNAIILGAAALCLAGIAAPLAKKLDSKPGALPQAAAATRSSAPADSPASAGANTLAVPRDRSGHFRVDAVIGGRRLDFLVDTGATVIALTKRDADRLGLNPAPRDYTMKMQTANGIVRAAQVRLTAVDIGPLTVRDVTAVVMPDGALAQNLLGMSFLSRLRRFEFRTGQLVMEQ